MNITAEEKKALKGRGYIMTRDNEHFIARVITENGVLNTEQMECLVSAAEKFGNGDIAMTSRLTLEVQGIPYENIEPFNSYIAKAGLVTGGTGSRVRPIVPCKGTVCVHGIVDTQKLGTELHEEFYKKWYDVKLPHKFKIGIGGCPNNCIKPSLNDFGIMGQHVPDYDPDSCNACKKCSVTEVCPVQAATVGPDGKLAIDFDKCNNCGKCIGACTFDSIEEKCLGYKVFLGGIWGKTQRVSTPIDRIFTKEELFKIIEKTLLLYREQGQTGERFGRTIDRIGPDKFVEMVLSDDVLSRKQAILDAKLHETGGATC